jgi:hypothetical protein
MKIAPSIVLLVVVSTFPAPVATAQDDPEAVVRAIYSLLSLDPSRPMDRERLDEYFWDDAVVGFGTSLGDAVVMPVGRFFDDLEKTLRAGRVGGVGHTMDLEHLDCWPLGNVTQCFARYRLVRPGEEVEEFFGGMTFVLRLHDGRWLIDSVSWIVDPEEGIVIRPDVAVALQVVPTASRGFRRTPERTWDRVFPILGQKLVEKGVSFPLPVGVGLIGTWKKMDIELFNLEVALNDGERVPGDILEFGRSVATSGILQAKFDLWLLPFLNVYGLVGRVEGETEMPMSVLGSDLLELLGAGDLCEGMRPSPSCFKTYSTTVTPPIAGWNFVFGMNPALGLRNFFFLMPTTFTWTDLDVGRWVRSFYVSPRVGLSVPTERAGALSVYIGAAYLNADNFINGTVTLDTDLPVPPDGQVTIEYWVDTKNKDRWNYLVGFNWALSKRLSVHAEVDAGGSRQGTTGSLTFRF